MQRTGFCLLVLVPSWFLLPVGPGKGEDPPGLAAVTTLGSPWWADRLLLDRPVKRMLQFWGKRELRI